MTDEEKVLASFEEVKLKLLENVSSHTGKLSFIKFIILVGRGYAFVMYNKMEQRFESIEYKNRVMTL